MKKFLATLFLCLGTFLATTTYATISNAPAVGTESEY